MTTTTVRCTDGTPYVEKVSRTQATVKDSLIKKYGLPPSGVITVKQSGSYYSGSIRANNKRVIHIRYPGNQGGTGYLMFDDGSDPPDNLETFTLDNGLWESDSQSPNYNRLVSAPFNRRFWRKFFRIFSRS